MKIDPICSSPVGHAVKKNDLAIFIVDDDDSLCRALARLLKSAGYRNVGTFSSAEDFMLSSSPEEQSLLVLDLQLPGMSGIDLLQALRESGRSIPVVLISAHDEELMRAKSLPYDRVAFLHKPFEEKDLLSVIGSITR